MKVIGIKSSHEGKLINKRCKIKNYSFIHEIDEIEQLELDGVFITCMTNRGGLIPSHLDMMLVSQKSSLVFLKQHGVIT